jgi:uncharacterized protein with HEPN domain
MKTKNFDQDRLVQIKESIEYIEEFTRDVTYDQYINDYKLRLAIVKLLEIIGEASSCITRETHKKLSAHESATLNNIRNVLVQEYFGIDYDIIWNTIAKQIPELKDKIMKIIDKLN